MQCQVLAQLFEVRELPPPTDLTGAGPIRWPALASLGLGQAQRAERREGVGGSDANAILSGRGDRITEL